MRDPAPSGTVVVLRDAPRLELLLLERVPRESERGPWVFPGGKVEEVDLLPEGSALDAARRAAIREAREEAGLALAAPALAPISRWITPPATPRRFDTWFFATAVAPEAEVRVDGVEIAAHRWIAPADALHAHARGALRLAPPTFVTLSWLAEFPACAEALRVLPARRPPPIHPRLHSAPGGTCMLYPGDAGYEAGRLDLAGPRHRLWMLAGGWRYERRSLDTA